MGNAMEEGNASKSTLSCTFGIAAADKVFESRELNVYVKDLLPFHEGELKATDIKNKVKVTGDLSSGYEGETTTKNYVVAEYLDLLSNRVHPPDVRRGEQVMLLNIADTDKYFWYSMGRDDNLRRTERLRFAISDDVAYQKELDDDNTWYIEFDTLTGKTFILSTSKSDTSNPVKYRYLIKIDAENDTLVISDDGNNEIRLNSDIPQIYMRNRDGSIVDINKKNIIIAAPEDIILKAGRQIVRDAPVETNQNTKGDGTTVMKAANLSIECSDSFTVAAPSTGLEGNVVVNGPIKTGPMQSEGYSTGSTSAYTPASIDLGSGGGKGGNTPQEVSPDPNNRHCAAYEDLLLTVQKIVQDLERIDEVTGYGASSSEILSLATGTKMNKNRGE